MVRLEDVTVKNWRACVELEVGASQERFTRSNLYTIAEAQFYPNVVTRAILTSEGEVIGLVLYGQDDEDGNCWIYRFMIDGRYQGRGYGRAALRLIMREMSARSECLEVRLRCHKENSVAMGLYDSVEFQRVTDQGDQVVLTKSNRNSRRTGTIPSDV